MLDTYFLLYCIYFCTVFTFILYLLLYLFTSVLYLLLYCKLIFLFLCTSKLCRMPMNVDDQLPYVLVSSTHTCYQCHVPSSAALDWSAKLPLRGSAQSVFQPDTAALPSQPALRYGRPARPPPRGPVSRLTRAAQFCPHSSIRRRTGQPQRPDCAPRRCRRPHRALGLFPASAVTRGARPNWDGDVKVRHGARLPARRVICTVSLGTAKGARRISETVGRRNAVFCVSTMHSLDFVLMRTSQFQVYDYCQSWIPWISTPCWGGVFEYPYPLTRLLGLLKTRGVRRSKARKN